jgi:hypothetical protein
MDLKGCGKKEVFIAWFKVFQPGTEENHEKRR